MSDKPAASNEAEMRFWGNKLTAPVLERVVGMLVARAQAPIDKLDDATLLTDAIAAHATDFTGANPTGIKVVTSPDGLTLAVAPLNADAAKALIASTELPEIGNVVEHLTSALEHRDDTLHMTLKF